MHDLMNRPDDHEAKMARADLFKLAQYSFKLFKMIGENQELEGWVQAKITKAADYISSVYHYMQYEMQVSEYGDHLENAEMYSESIRRAFQQKLMEAKDKMKALKKAQAEKMKKKDDKKKDEKVEEATGFTAKDKRKGKIDTSTKSQYSVKLTHTDGAKTKNVHYDADEGESEGEVRDRANRDHKSQGYSVDSIRKKTSENTMAQPKPDFLDMDKDGNKKEPMKKAVADKKVKETAISGAPQKSGISATAKTTVPGMRATQQDLKKANSSAALGEGKCNHTPKGKSCPVHGLKECGSMYEASHQAKTTMKHVKNPTAGEKKAAKDIKPGIAGYKDRVAMLKSAEKDGRLKA